MGWWPAGPTSVPMAVAGAVGCGRLAATALRGSAPTTRLCVLSMSLIPVALAYPLARTATPDRRAILREVGGVTVMGVVATLAVRSDRINQAAALGCLARRRCLGPARQTLRAVSSKSSVPQDADGSGVGQCPTPPARAPNASARKGRNGIRFRAGLIVGRGAAIGR